MDSAPITLIAAVGPGGVIGSVGKRPEFPDRESAMDFRYYVSQKIVGSNVIMGGRAYRQMVSAGFQHKDAPFSPHRWDRDAQGMMKPEDMVDALLIEERPIFLLGGAFTFAEFMPWVGSIIIHKAALTVGDDPVYMPELFPRTQ